MKRRQTMAKLDPNSIRKYFQKPAAHSSTSDNRKSQTGLVLQDTNHVKKEDAGERPSKRPHLQQQSEGGKSHTFTFCLKTAKYGVTTDMSKTVLDALKTDKSLLKTIKQNETKEIVILKSNVCVDKVAIQTDFPCSLIKKDEILDLTFIKSDGTEPIKQNKRCSLVNARDFVWFTVKTTGGDNVKRLMRNNELRKKVESVLVFASKDEKVKTALLNDGRFKDEIFLKRCALYDLQTDTEYNLSQTVEHLNGKHFKIIDTKDETLPSSVEETLSDELNNACSPEPENTNPDQNSMNTEDGKPLQRSGKEDKQPSSESYKKIPDSEETLNYLRAQFAGLLETLLKRQEKKRTKHEIQKGFREEYDKSVQSFSEVYKVRELMKLSESVCQIRADGSAIGSGFLLFDRFIITNAHVVSNFAQTDQLYKELEAVFDFERLDSKVTVVPIKKQIPVYCHQTDATERRIDFALLELASVEKITGRPELLKFYNPNCPPQGNICIVGHPEGGIKKMDPCFTIRKNKINEAVNKHSSENEDYINVINAKSLKENWQIYENQISYNSCFFHGSSGSPVFDDDCKLIGVHTGGYVYNEKSNKFRSVLEYGYSMESILERIRAVVKIKGLNEIFNILQKYNEDKQNVNNEEHCDDTARNENEIVPMDTISH